MTGFLLDIWHDLREKRLWPVAVALAVGLIALPVLLSRSSAGDSTAPAPSPVPAATGPKDPRALASVRLATDDRDSYFGTFDPSDPFRPAGDGEGEASTAESAADTATTDGAVASAAPATTSGGSTGSTSSPSLGIIDSPSAGGFTETPSTSDGSADNNGSGNSQPEPAEYTFVVDATFVANGRKRKLDGMERLDMLPNRSAPLLLFLGVAAKGGNAVFLVDSTLQAAGEGKCKPREDDCAFLYLGPGSEEMFTNDQGDSYTLRIREIRKVKVGDEPKSADEKKKDDGAKASTARRRFVAPVLTDLVSLSDASKDD